MLMNRTSLQFLNQHVVAFKPARCAWLTKLPLELTCVCVTSQTQHSDKPGKAEMNTREHPICQPRSSDSQPHRREAGAVLRSCASTVHSEVWLARWVELKHDVALRVDLGIFATVERCGRFSSRRWSRREVNSIMFLDFHLHCRSRGEQQMFVFLP